METYTKNLDELNRKSLPEAGGKGAGLGEMILAGLPVPPGFVVTTGAYLAHLEASGLRERIANRIANLKEDDYTAITEASGDISSWIENAPMPGPVREEARTAYAHLSGMAGAAGESAKYPVAVRSSATAEDLPSASFAGQHETYLGIRGIDAVLDHIKKCWASLWSAQAISYRTGAGFEHLEVNLAVVVQAMIPAETAGVMFTANPVNGSREEIMVSAGYGLGETIVSGLITPDTFVLSKAGRVKEQTLGEKDLQIVLTETGTGLEEVPSEKRKAFCLGNPELVGLSILARRVEQHYGSPMDTEWALSEGKIYLLQARPITTDAAADNSSNHDSDILGPGDKILYQGKKPPYILTMTMDLFSEPVTPLDFAYLYRRYQASTAMLQDMGMSLPKTPIMPVERESGCVALRLTGPEPSLSMLWKLPIFKLQGAHEDTKELWLPVCAEMGAWLENKEAGIQKTSDPAGAARMLEQMLEEFGALFRKRCMVFFKSAKAADADLARMVKKAVGKGRAEEMKERLYRALPFRTELQNEALAHTAQTAKAMGKESEAFLNDFAKFMEEYGDRPALSAAPTLGSPTWRERPEFVHGLIDALMQDEALMDAEGYLQKQENVRKGYEAAKQEIRARLSQGAYSKFEKALERARNATIVREESSFLVEKLTACIRRMALKLGGMLAERALIDDAGDVFFLFLDELGPVATGEAGGSGEAGKAAVREKIEKRKGAYAKVYAAHEKGIHWMNSTGSFPVFDTAKKGKGKGNGGDAFQGACASRGVYEGTVRVVNSPAEFDKLKKGDVLVSACTTPTWTPLFRVAGAVVTERGSPLSHAAIVSREYGIPCVVAVDGITKLLTDGQRIRVDGTNGLVTILLPKAIPLAAVPEGGNAHA
ncbi:MAG: pyruvate, phosphate dikinase [Clostridiales Family XIII bacterium]|jgi:pyruvate,water dikinase|nr:pyruvate, phosphate dikinase [Clostridiales Family XIII bacterium]